MQAKVPKFLDIEDRVVGPLTLRQFIVLAVGAAFIGVFNFLVAFFPLFLAIATLITGVSVAVAFVRVNERSFMEYALSVLSFYFFGQKQFVWRRIPPKVRVHRKVLPKAEKPHDVIPARVARKKIRDLASQLDMYQPVKRRDY